MSEAEASEATRAAEEPFDLDTRQRLQVFAAVLGLVFLIVLAIAFL